MSNMIPKPGMGITISIGSDKYPGTITRVSTSGKTFRFRRDRAKKIDQNGPNGPQIYEYAANPDAEEERAFLSNIGTLGDGGKSWRVSKNKFPICLDRREKFSDPSF